MGQTASAVRKRKYNFMVSKIGLAVPFTRRLLPAGFDVRVDQTRGREEPGIILDD